MLCIAENNVSLDAVTVSTVSQAHLKAHAPHVLDKFAACHSWCRALLRELNLVKRKGTTAAAKLPANWEERKNKLTLQVCTQNNMLMHTHVCWRNIQVYLLLSARCTV